MQNIEDSVEELEALREMQVRMTLQLEDLNARIELMKKKSRR